MRHAYTEIDFAALNKLLKLARAKIIGGRLAGETTLRLFLTIDEPRRPFEKSPEFVSLDKLLDETDLASIFDPQDEDK